MGKQFSVTVPVRMFELDLPTRQKELYILLVGISGIKGRGYSYASNAYLAKATHTYESNISRSLKALEQKGYISIGKGEEGRRHITPLKPPGWPNDKADEGTGKKEEVKVTSLEEMKEDLNL